MRSLFLFALLGVAIMSTATESVAQEKKDKKEEKYPIKITVKSWDLQGKKFLKPTEVDARKVENKGRTAFFVGAKQAFGLGKPTTGSEITDADGTVWVVKSGTESGGEYQATVEKKP